MPDAHRLANPRWQALAVTAGKLIFYIHHVVFFKSLYFSVELPYFKPYSQYKGCCRSPHAARRPLPEARCPGRRSRLQDKRSAPAWPLFYGIGVKWAGAARAATAVAPADAAASAQRLSRACSYSGITRCEYTRRSARRSSRDGWVDRNLIGSEPPTCAIFCHRPIAARGS